MAMSLFFDPVLFDMSKEMTRALEPFVQPKHAAGGPCQVATSVQSLPMDIIEYKDHYSIVADAPGFTPDDITVEMVENRLTIIGKKRKERDVHEQSKVMRVHRRERTFNKFTRSFTVPEGTKAEAVTAKVEQGVLTVDIPKEVQKVPEPKRIRVTGGTAADQPAPRLKAAAPTTPGPTQPAAESVPATADAPVTA